MAATQSGTENVASKLGTDEGSSVGEPYEVNLVRVLWLATVLPTLAIGLFEFLRHQVLANALPEWLGFGWFGNVVGAMVVAATVYGFVRLFARMVENSAAEAARAREKAAVLAERQRIAREMHDRVAQALFYLTVKLREVEDTLPAAEGESARADLLDVESNLKETYRQVREVIMDLKRQTDAASFSESLRDAVEEASRRSGLRTACRTDGEPDLSPRSRQHLLAIVQEALSNAHRHGRAREARVVAKTGGAHMVIEVTDDGCGFDPGSSHGNGGYGLAIMSERARMVGGELSVDSSPARGTRVRVEVPMGEHERY